MSIEKRAAPLKVRRTLIRCKVLHRDQEVSPTGKKLSYGCLFRSFRTYMSIEKQTYHRFQGPLGP